MRERQQKPKRGKQRGHNQYRVHVYFEDGAAWKEWNDEGNLTLQELSQALREVAGRIDKFSEAVERKAVPHVR